MQPSGAAAKVNDSSTWCTYDEVRAYPHGLFLTGDCTVIDLDHCFDNGRLSDFARNFLKRIPENAYVEMSQSRTGLHIFLPEIRISGSGIKRQWIEIYSERRFVVTGTPAPELLSYRDPMLPAWTAQELEGFRVAQPSTSARPQSRPYDKSSSEEDWAFVCRLMERGLPDAKVRDQWLKERWREKLQRNDYIERTIANARNHVSRHHPSRRWKPPTKATPTIKKLWEYVESHGLFPWSFSIDYGRLAQILHTTKRNAWNQIRYAALLGQIVIVHRGWQGHGGANTAAIFALVDRRGNTEEALELAKKYKLYKDRVAQFNRAEVMFKAASRVSAPLSQLTQPVGFLTVADDDTGLKSDVPTREMDDEETARCVGETWREIERQHELEERYPLMPRYIRKAKAKSDEYWSRAGYLNAVGPEEFINEYGVSGYDSTCKWLKRKCREKSKWNSSRYRYQSLGWARVYFGMKW